MQLTFIRESGTMSLCYKEEAISGRFISLLMVSLRVSTIASIFVYISILRFLDLHSIFVA